MKTTGDDTRMIEVSAGKWVEVRGDAVLGRRVNDVIYPNLIGLPDRVVLILELVQRLPRTATRQAPDCNNSSPAEK